MAEELPKWFRLKRQIAQHCNYFSPPLNNLYKLRKEERKARYCTTQKFCPRLVQYYNNYSLYSCYGFKYSMDEKGTRLCLI